MKRQFSVLVFLAVTLGALATQSCESTDGRQSYYNRDHYSSYRDGRYVGNNGYYHDGSYPGDIGYYHERHYVGDGSQSDRPAIDLHF